MQSIQGQKDNKMTAGLFFCTNKHHRTTSTVSTLFSDWRWGVNRMWCKTVTGSVATSLAHTKCTKHYSLTTNTQKHVSNVCVWSVLNERIWAKTTNVTNMSHKSGGFLSSAIRRHVMCVFVGQWVWKCCGDANVTRCCPLSHVTSVIDAEWFWKQCVGVQGGGKRRGGEKEGKCGNKEKINECSECRVLKSVPAFSLLLTQSHLDTLKRGVARWQVNSSCACV